MQGRVREVVGTLIHVEEVTIVDAFPEQSRKRSAFRLMAVATVPDITVAKAMEK